MASEDNPSETVVSQRVRNRIIESLELAASFEDQLEYQLAVPYINVPNEVINQWEDWVGSGHFQHFKKPVFSLEEQTAIRVFHATWDAVADDTPDYMPPLKELFLSEPWNRLRLAASVALAIFMQRGRFDETTEEDFDQES